MARWGVAGRGEGITARFGGARRFKAGCGEGFWTWQSRVRQGRVGRGFPGGAGRCFARQGKASGFVVRHSKAKLGSAMGSAAGWGKAGYGVARRSLQGKDLMASRG